MTKVKRFQSLKIDAGSTKIEDNGWLRTRGFLTRTGVFDYRKNDGSLFKEYRPEDEVFNEDSMKSFELVPLTNDHPDVALDASNTKDFALGAISGVRRVGEFLEADIIVYDQALVDAISAGKQELSCGYFCELQGEPGVFKDSDGVEIKYDAVQRGIRGNHVAVVKKGRAGAKARIYMDSEDAVMLESEAKGETQMVKINLDGSDLEVTEEVKSAFDKIVAENAAIKQDKADSDLAMEALKSELAAFKKDIADKQAAEKRAELEALATAAGVTNFDGLSDNEVMVAVVLTTAPDFNADGKSADYIQARFDATIEFINQKNLVSAQASQVVKGDAVNNVVDYKQKLIEQLSAHK